MIAVLVCIIPLFRLFCQRKAPAGPLIWPGCRPACKAVSALLASGKHWINRLHRSGNFPSFSGCIWPPVMPGVFSYIHSHAQEGRSLRTVPLAYRKDIERDREKRDISFPSCAAASDRHPERTPAYRSPTASADSHRRWRGYPAWWASPAGWAGKAHPACRAPQEW